MSVKPSEEKTGDAKRRWVRRLMVSFGVVVVCLFLGILGHNLFIARGVDQEIASASRDPATGIITGTEAVTLGDTNATTAVLMLHGFVGSRIDFGDLGDRIAAEGYCVRMTLLPGHGTTPRDFATTTPEELIEAARDEAEALRAKHEGLVIVGFSMGGAIATILASEGLADYVVLISPYYDVTYFPYYILPPNVWNRIFSPVIPFVRKGETFIKVNKRESVPEMFSYTHVPTRGARTLAQLGERARDPNLLAAITCPVFMIHSRGDEAADFDAALTALEGMISATPEMMAPADRNNHHLLWDHDAEEIKAAVVKYFRAIR